MHIAVKLIADNWGQNEERWFLGLSPKEMVIEKNIKMEIEYKLNVIPPTEEIIDLYNKSGLPRPTEDSERIKVMFENSNLVITAWQHEKLVGVCRCITDWVWSCYLADLAVDPDLKQRGIGRKMVELARERLGDQVMLLLLSVPEAMEYYPKLGFSKENRAFSINRKS
jgi:ribosomal protein S18 acetylase RimI-like enzyme